MQGLHLDSKSQQGTVQAAALLTFTPCGCALWQ